MLKTLALGAALALTALPAFAAGEEAHVTDYAFPFEGPFGSYDKLQLQRGLQVYTEVCASCHGLSYVAFRTLAAAGTSGSTGPNLDDLAPTAETVATVVKAGSGTMPSFDGTLNDDQIAAVAAFVAAR